MMSEAIKDLGNNIKIMRIKNNIRQAEAARVLGISQTHMSNIESGRASLNIKFLVRLAELFSCSTDELLGLSPKNQANNQSDDISNLLSFLGKISREDLRQLAQRIKE